MKKIWFIGMSLIFSLIVYTAAGPLITLAGIKTGLVEQNQDKLSSNIDFPLLRSNIKVQLMREVDRHTEKKDDPLLLVGSVVAAGMIDAIVDSLVTPAGIARMMLGNQPSKTNSALNLRIERFKKEDLLKDASWSYDSINQFSVTIVTKRGTKIQFILKREYIFWKLVNILPEIQ